MRKYTVQESNNIALGQLGFDDLAAGTHTGTWVAIKAVGGRASLGDLEVSIGDDIRTTGSFGATLVLDDGEILYAPFNSIIVITVATNGALIAYRG